MSKVQKEMKFQTTTNNPEMHTKGKEKESVRFINISSNQKAVRNANQNTKVNVKEAKASTDNKINNVAQQIDRIRLEPDTCTNFNENMVDMNYEEEITKENLEKFYLERENKNLILNYGSELYEFSKELENRNSLNASFLNRHSFEPKMRTKMVDWMIEVLYTYNSDPQTYYLAVNIMDMFISKVKGTLSANDIHLTGICCMFIASKMEDMIPLRMSLITSKIGHNKFSESTIKKREKLILETINFDVIMTSTYDFIKTFIYDFCHNNNDYIQELDLYNLIDIFGDTAVYLSKLMFHFEEFSQYK